MQQPGFEPGSLPWQGNILTRLNHCCMNVQEQERLYKDYVISLFFRNLSGF